MEYRHREPVTQSKRRARAERQRSQQQRKEEKNRRLAKGGGRPNALGVTQGQNGEQGNTLNPTLTQTPAEPGGET